MAASRFSERIGLKPVKSALQIRSMDTELRNGIWNVLQIFCWNQLHRGVHGSMADERDKGAVFFTAVWMHFLKEPIDTRPSRLEDALGHVRTQFFGWEWHTVYDFLEFTVGHFPFDPDSRDRESFVSFCNAVLERELSGYRLVDGVVTPITSEDELQAVHDAVTGRDRLEPARKHLQCALRHLSDRKAPDYRNSIKESISAVEAACKIVTGKAGATLGVALDELERKRSLHPALKKAFNSLYGYTSDAEGIRHALLEEATLDFDDAKFMLVCCSAFINFLAARTLT